jgi:hypothetical protein
MGASLGLIGPLASIAGAIFGGGSTANNVPQAPPVYQPTGAAGADQGVQGGIANLAGSVPGANAAVNYLYNNPGAPGAVQGANTAGLLGQAAGLQDFTQGGNLTNVGNSIVPYATAALNTGFDPMGNVYKQDFQQNTDQTRALLEARGIDSTPYGAGVEAQSNLNFNTNWENNLLNRETAGASTASNLLNTSASDITGGANLSGQAPGTYYGGAVLPYQTAQNIGTNQLGALAGGQAIQQAPISDWQTYLNYVNQAAGVGTQQQQTNLNQNQLAFNQNQQLGKNLGAGIQGLGKGVTGWQNNTPAWATSGL